MAKYANFFIFSQGFEVCLIIVQLEQQKLHHIILWRASFIHVENIFNNVSSHFLDLLNNNDLHPHSHSIVCLFGSSYPLEILYHWTNL